MLQSEWQLLTSVYMWFVCPQLICVHIMISAVIRVHFCQCFIWMFSSVGITQYTKKGIILIFIHSDHPVFFYEIYLIDKQPAKLHWGCTTSSWDILKSWICFRQILSKIRKYWIERIFVFAQNIMIYEWRKKNVNFQIDDFMWTGET